MSKQCLSVSNDDGVLLSGYHKKLKTMKKKFFVLFKESAYNGARIEYYDNEKKFKSGFTPKRVIKIKNCFNINRRLYTKHEFVIVLSSKEGGFGIVLDSEEEMNTWLKNLLMLQRAEKITFDVQHFDYVWQVIIQKKGIAEQHGFFGNYNICLTNKSITFIKIGQENTFTSERRTAKIEVLLTTIRRCGDSQCFFYMEIGRQSTLGPGELWMETEDPLTAKNMHKMILSKMTSLNEALAEPMRKRSSSATEASNPLHDRKPIQHFDKPINYFQTAHTLSRERCDSLPSRNRTTSECCNNSFRMTSIATIPRVQNVQVSKSSPIAYSPSEESASVADSEESSFTPYLLSFQRPVRAYSVGNKNEQNQTPIAKEVCGETFGNRVRAFSVGSRLKNTRPCLKTSPKYFNSNNIENNCPESATKKSISVPMLINKSFKSVEQMTDLMEIDFSKSFQNTPNSPNQHQSINESQPHLDCSNSMESIPYKHTDNGYLEMRPITAEPTTNITTTSTLAKRNDDSSRNKNQPLDFLQNNAIDNAIVNSEFQHDNEVKDMCPKHSTDNLMCSTTTTSNANEDYNIKKEGELSPDNSICNTSNNKERFSVNVNTISSDNVLESSKLRSMTNLKPTSKNCILNNCNLKYGESLSLNNELNYASLDLPLCSKDLKKSNVKESLSDTNIGNTKNVYAKINFDQPEISSFSVRKNH